jgi:Zn-finger protein
MKTEGRRIRACIKCGTPLELCNGCVLARDICDAVDGKIPWTDVRELCARCAWIHRDTLATDPLERTG